MRKKIAFLLLMATVAAALPAEDLSEHGYAYLKSLSLPEQMALMEGFILGSYAALVAANKMYGLDKDCALNLMVLDESASQLLFEVCSWYMMSKNYSVPIYVAIYRRKL
jgi:hypothetical protein